MTVLRLNTANISEKQIKGFFLPVLANTYVVAVPTYNCKILYREDLMKMTLTDHSTTVFYWVIYFLIYIDRQPNQLTALLSQVYNMD